jgi:hypothetical protein
MYLSDVIIEEVMAPMNLNTRKHMCRSGVDEHRREAAADLRQSMKLRGCVVRNNRIRQCRYSGTNSIHRTGHIDNLVAKPAERSPPAIPDTSIDLPFRESTCTGLIRTNGSALKRRNLGHQPIGVHVDKLP